jgi:hypothetical protein
MCATQVGLWDLALPIYCAEVTPIRGGPTGEATYKYPSGTGFVIAPGVLATCWHCVRPRTDGLVYIAISNRGDGVLGHHLMKQIGQDPSGLDLATAAIDYEPRHSFQMCADPDKVGTDVWSVGYPLTESHFLDNGLRSWHPEPRILKGYVTRVFSNVDHGTFPPEPSYELDMPMPEGMSGGPLLLRNSVQGDLTLLGMSYGAHDVYTIMQEASLDPDTGELRHEVRRYVSFGLAHQLNSLLSLVGEATGGRPIRELLKSG